MLVFGSGGGPADEAHPATANAAASTGMPRKPRAPRCEHVLGQIPHAMLQRSPPDGPLDAIVRKHQHAGAHLTGRRAADLHHRAEDAAAPGPHELRNLREPRRQTRTPDKEFGPLATIFTRRNSPTPAGQSST